MEFDRYLDTAVKEVKEALGGGGVAILVPPGSARDKVVAELVKEGVVGKGEVLLYEDLHRRVELLLYEELRRRVELGRPLRREGDQFYADKQSLLDYLKSNAALRKVVIVPRDAWEALLIRDALLKALEEEKWTIGDVKKFVKVLFLPALYQEGDEEVAELARVDYGDVLKGVVKDARGVSPSLARLAEEYKARGNLGDLEQLIAAVKGLAPGQSAKALYELTGEVAGGFASEAARRAAETVPGVLAAGAMLVIAGLNPLAIAASAVAGWAAQKIVAKLWELLGKARGRESDVIRDTWHLIQQAQKLHDYFCPRERAENFERLEAVVDEVAAKWGMSIGQFKDFICKLGALAASREVTVEELEERLRRLEGLTLLRASAPAAVYVEAWEWPYVAEVGEELVVLEGAVKGPYVETRLEEELAKRLEAAVEKARRGIGRVVLLRGAKGVGKSTAAAAALYKLLKGGRAAVAVFDLGAAVDEARTAQFLSEATRRGLAPVLYLDSTRVEFYSSHALARPPIVQAAANLAKLVELAKRHGAAALVVLSEDQAEAIVRSKELGEEAKKMLFSDVDVVVVDDVLEVEPFVKALVEKYSGCPSDVVEGAADAVTSSFRDGYALAAVLAADWLRRGGCRGEEVEKAVERARGDVHCLALDYIWHVVLSKDVSVARWAAPLILATGFFGLHPPKLGEAVAVAMSHVVEEVFGAGSTKRDDDALKWFTSPLHGILYEAIRRVARGAVYKQLSRRQQKTPPIAQAGAGGDEFCQRSAEGSCLLVEICTKVLERLPCEKCNTAVDVEEEYAKWAAKRFINTLIQDFLQAFNGVAEDKRWRIRYEVETSEGVKTVEDVVNELDILSALYGMAALSVWDPQLKQLRAWFFVSGWKVGVVGLYLLPLLRERGRELVKRAVAIVHEAERRGSYTDVHFWQSVGIAAAGQWDSAADEELEKAVKLAFDALVRFATISLIVLVHSWPLLFEAWRRVVNRGAHGDGERRQSLADKLTAVAYSVARGHPFSLLPFFAVGIDELDLEAMPQSFDALYNAASNTGKLRLLDVLLYALGWDVDGVNVAAVLLGNPQLKPKRVFEEVARRVEGLVSHLHGIERTYVVTRLYPPIARWYTSFDELDKAVEFAEESLKALEELWKVYEEDRESTKEKLRPYLELMWVKLDLGRKLNELSLHVYHYVAHVYIDVDELDKAVEYAEKACKIAGNLGEVYYEVSLCNLLSRLKAVESGAPLVEEFEKVWQRASQGIEELGAEAVATALGEYVVALASVGRLGEVKKVLDEWGWALVLHPDTLVLTYGVLFLFDGWRLEKVLEQVRANLPKLADALHDATEAGLFAKDPEIVKSAVKRLDAYGKDVVTALVGVVSDSAKLFLSALVGLAYCKRGEEWGLKLAREAAQAGSHRFKGIVGRPFSELYKVLEGATVGNCLTEGVLRVVYKLYYYHV